MISRLFLILLLCPTLSYAQVLHTDGAILDGQTGHALRPKGQLLFESDPHDSTSHAIITGHIANSDDEGAIEFMVKSDDGSSRQISADFVRTIDSGWGTGDWLSARVVRAIHINSGAKGDTTPFAVYDGNSVRFLLGNTGALPWNKVPISDNIATFGAAQQIQIMPGHSSGSSLFQVYNVVSKTLEPLLLSAKSFVFSGGNIEPNVNNVRELGASHKRFKRLWATDAALGSVILGDAISYNTGTGSPEGVLQRAVGSIYTNQSGGAGSVLYIKEYGGAGATGWVAK